MTTSSASPQASRFSDLLGRREAELHALLRSRGAVLDEDAAIVEPHEVSDFKDAAAEESLVRVDEAQTEHAMRELELIQAARRRLEDGSYGFCLDCGDPIDDRRLTALPYTPYCTACQAVHEHTPPGRR